MLLLRLLEMTSITYNKREILPLKVQYSLKIPLCINILKYFDLKIFFLSKIMDLNIRVYITFKLDHFYVYTIGNMYERAISCIRYLCPKDQLLWTEHFLFDFLCLFFFKKLKYAAILRNPQTKDLKDFNFALYFQCLYIHHIVFCYLLCIICVSFILIANFRRFKFKLYNIVLQLFIFYFISKLGSLMLLKDSRLSRLKTMLVVFDRPGQKK